MTHKRILVLFAHPSIERSEVNSLLFRISRETAGVTLVDLYAEYPTFNIDIDREQQRLLSHDIIVFMHPLYWFSTPALLKEWQDLVLEYGFAYGTGGTALQGKFLFNALTAGGPEDAYQTEGFHQATLAELLRPLERTARLCGMRYLPPFTLFGARTALEEGRVPMHVAHWGELLQRLHQDQVDFSRAEASSQLNELITTLAESIQ